jgi:hypothetical protein
MTGSIVSFRAMPIEWRKEHTMKHLFLSITVCSTQTQHHIQINIDILIFNVYPTCHRSISATIFSTFYDILRTTHSHGISVRLNVLRSTFVTPWLCYRNEYLVQYCIFWPVPHGSEPLRVTYAWLKPHKARIDEVTGVVAET